VNVIVSPASAVVGSASFNTDNVGSLMVTFGALAFSVVVPEFTEKFAVT